MLGVELDSSIRRATAANPGTATTHISGSVGGGSKPGWTML